MPRENAQAKGRRLLVEGRLVAVDGRVLRVARYRVVAEEGES